MQRIAAKLAIGLAITAIGMFAADNSIGTWKYNPVKSKPASSTMFNSRTDMREATPDGGVKVTRRIENWRFFQWHLYLQVRRQGVLRDRDTVRLHFG